MQSWAVITGATSGLGEAYAKILSADGHSLLLTGRRTDKLEAVASDVRRSGIDVRTLRCELSEESDILSLLEVVGALPQVGWLINNAGYGDGADFIDGAAVSTMLRVHVDAALRLMRMVLPRMVDAGAGNIINVGSLASLLAVPGSAGYVATKAFLLRFTESVALEVSGAGVNMQILLPGYFRSDFHRDLGWTDKDKKSRGLVRWMDAHEVAASSIRACRRGRTVVHVPGMANKVAYILARTLPRRLLYSGALRFRRGQKEKADD